MELLLAPLRALADPTRLRIMLLIRHMELSVGELAAVLGQSQPRVSRHIRILAEAGLAERRKEGAWVWLRPGSGALLDALAGQLDMVSEGREAAADRARLAEVRAARARAAADWFAAHAAEWDGLRALHVADSEVERTMAAMLGDAPMGRLLDIGTGTGRMIELFGARAAQVTALDNSPEMLRIARAKLGDGAGGELAADMLLGDFNALPLADAGYDLVLLHQVLHFAQTPERVIGEAARVLAPGGRLLIADFAPHEREELRRDHAHARLGFADDDMARWFAAAGLTPAQTRRLDGGPLGVSLWLGVRHSERRPLPFPDARAGLAA